MSKVRIIWAHKHLVIDQRTFGDSLSAHRFVRKTIGTLPSCCHAKWTNRAVTVMNGAEYHSTFTLEILR